MNALDSSIQTVLIIGAGRVGTSLYRVLSEKTNYTAKLFDIHFSRLIDQNLLNPGDKVKLLTEASLINVGMIFICTQDDAIENVVSHLSQFDLKDKYVLHTAGSLDSGILESLKSKGTKTGSLHPMQTFDQRFSDIEIWNNIICSYEGSEEIFQEIQILCAKLDAHLIRVSPDQKTALHLAGVITANFLVGLISWAEEVLKNSQLKDIEYPKILIPLMQKTLNNYKIRDIGKILTGPINRGDINTIKNHLKYLEKSPDTLNPNLYKLIARMIASNSSFDISNREALLQLFGIQ